MIETTLNTIYFSIIIPMYNRKHCIKKTLSTVLYQTFKNFEVLLIDDGSTDGTEEFIKNTYTNELDNNIIRYIKTDHLGVSNARNIGIENSKYDWIAYLDSDDFYSQNFLFEFANAIINNKDKLTFYCKHAHIYDFGWWESKEFTLEELNEKTNIAFGCFVHHKHLYNELGGFEVGRHWAEDFRFVRKYVNKHFPCFIDKVLVYINNGNHNRLTTIGYLSNSNTIELFTLTDKLTYYLENNTFVPTNPRLQSYAVKRILLDGLIYELENENEYIFHSPNINLWWHINLNTHYTSGVQIVQQAWERNNISFLDMERNIIYYKINKTGNSTLYKTFICNSNTNIHPNDVVLWENYDIMATNEDLELLNVNDFLKFTVWRDPVERFYSQLFHANRIGYDFQYKNDLLQNYTHMYKRLLSSTKSQSSMDNIDSIEFLLTVMEINQYFNRRDDNHLTQQSIIINDLVERYGLDYLVDINDNKSFIEDKLGMKFYRADSMPPKDTDKSWEGIPQKYIDEIKKVCKCDYEFYEKYKYKLYKR